MTKRHPDVTAFIDRASRWPEEMEELREILLDLDLTEEIKWGKPCYAAHGGNVVIMQPFKAHLALMFFKGALLDDPEGILSLPGENTRAARRIELTSPEQVTQRRSTLESYVEEAIAIEEAGLEVPTKKVADYDVPAELEERLREDQAYRKAFEELTPGRKKGYLLHFSEAKRADTRARRIERCRARILEGKGLHER